ncbi:hypothetical protein Q4R53_15385 [Morganella morganii]
MIYTDGTIAINAGSPIVTGTGTQWKKNIHGVAPGQLISIENGTAPVSMMIRAVNSDTELVLSFNAPVTLSGAKYSIATTVPDTISDAARTMSANQGYIVYFLRAMQQWMTDTGQVEIELPNGQKVTLEDVKGLASREWVGEMLYKPNSAVTRVQSPNKRNVVQLEDGGTVGFKDTVTDRYRFVLVSDGSTRCFSGGEYTGLDLVKTDGRYVRLETNPHAGASTMLTFVYRTAGGVNQHVVTLPYTNGAIAVLNGNVLVDSSGYVKKSSPMVHIYPDGHYKTNDESEGAEVLRTGTGQYHITGILGYNSDGAWGVNGGISVPKDNNGLELVYVDDRVQSDGSLIIETCHRQHAHLPERFQNWRLKEVTPEGERIFYQDGEPCDLPESTRLDVRVEMPQGSVWNVKQRELAEQMEREQAEREAQEAAGQGVDSDQ